MTWVSTAKHELWWVCKASAVMSDCVYWLFKFISFHFISFSNHSHLTFISSSFHLNVISFLVLFISCHLGVGHELKPLDLQWKSWGFAMRNPAKSLDLQWKTWGFAMRNPIKSLDLQWNSWDFARRNPAKSLHLHWKTWAFAVRNQAKSLDLHWKSWGVAGINPAKPLDLLWKTWAFAMRNPAKSFHLISFHFHFIFISFSFSFHFISFHFIHCSSSSHGGFAWAVTVHELCFHLMFMSTYGNRIRK